MMTNPQRGFTLLIAVILTSVLLSVGLALLDVAYKQVTLSSTARQSQTAFYAADSALECALYWDQQHNAFSYTAPAATITCGNRTITPSSSVSGGIRTTTFDMACPSGGTSAQVTIRKGNVGVFCNTLGNSNCLYANGYNSCNVSDERRIERGLKVVY